MNGPSEVDLGVELESIRGIFWVHFGSFGVHFGVRFGSMLRSDSDSGLRPLGTRFLDPWDRSWRFSWTPCWPYVGSMLEAIGRLEGSLGVSGPI